MLKYSLYTIKNSTFYNKLIQYKNGLQANTSKIDGIAFRGGAHN